MKNGVTKIATFTYVGMKHEEKTQRYKLRKENQYDNDLVQLNQNNTDRRDDDMTIVNVRE